MQTPPSGGVFFVATNGLHARNAGAVSADAKDDMVTRNEGTIAGDASPTAIHFS